MPFCAQCRNELAPGSRYCGACGAAAGAAGAGAGVTTRDVSGTGIAIGAGASAPVTQGVQASELAALLDVARARIAERPEDPDVDKEELAATVEAIEQEAAKGADANESKLSRWLGLLKDWAPDVLEVTAAALLNPVAGVADGVRVVARRMRADDASAS